MTGGAGRANRASLPEFLLAAPIVVRYLDQESRFELERLERARLYGRRRRVPLDPSGQPCTRASLTADGRLILRPGMTGQSWFDAEGRRVAQGDLVGLGPDGKPLPLQRSTLGVPQDLRGPVSPKEVLDLAVAAVYLLSAADISAPLAARLQAGEIYAFPFNFRADVRLETGYLLHNEHGYFALVGQPVSPEWLGLDAAPVVEDDAEEADDLDFEMF